MGLEPVPPGVVLKLVAAGTVHPVTASNTAAAARAAHNLIRFLIPASPVPNGPNRVIAVPAASHRLAQETAHTGRTGAQLIRMQSIEDQSL
jgi:hypothetical protein